MMQPPASAGDKHRDVQPWVEMQYPPAAMMMQSYMMGLVPPSPAHYVSHFFAHPPGPPQNQNVPPASISAGGSGSSSGEDNKSIWVGHLQYWMDENYLHSCFAYTGEVISIKVIRNKLTGQSEGYGFIEFCSHAAAKKVLLTFNGQPMPNAESPFRLNWASFSTGDRRSEVVSDHSIFVGDLASDVTDSMLQEVFASKYSSVKGAKVVVDPSNGRSKGYGFVRFGDEDEKTVAMTDMNGVYCSSRPMRICAATPRKSGGFGSSGSSTPGFQSDGDAANTTVFVGRLDPAVSEDELRQSFSQYGEIASIKIPAGKQCGFVQFVQRNSAEDALQALNGAVLGKQAVRLSWGRSPSNKQLRAEPSSQWSSGAYYGPPQVYDGYGFAVPWHNPMLYASAYGAHPVYWSQQQVS